MNIRIAVAALLLSSSLFARDDVRCRSRVVFPESKLSVSVPIERAHNGVFVQARVNAHPEPLILLVDSGSPHTVINAAIAKHLDVADVSAKSATASIEIGGVTIDRIDLVPQNLAPLAKAWAHKVDGIIGFDLLCRADVTVDYEKAQMTLTHPATFQYNGVGDSLKLYLRNGYSFVEGTIKVTGRPAVIDMFLVDSGSQDAVNHPIIRDSKGPLRKVSSTNVLGPNEWFQLGKYTIGSTNSMCCSSEENNRQIGSVVLARFRTVTFDYPHKRLIVERVGR